MKVLKSIIEASPNIDYFSRLVTGNLGEPFNGQKYRMSLFQALLGKFNFDTVIETGTNRGSTTQYIAQHFSGPIFSIEYMEKYADFSRLRTKKYTNIEIIINNSVDGLNSILRKQNLIGKYVFFYLDAHWYDYLPLQDELDLILKQNSDVKSVIMIDDFAVPHDNDYGFDSYKAGTLNYDYIKPVLTTQSEVFFPTTPAKLETGFKQGCAVICSNQELAKKLEAVPLLSKFSN